MESSQLIDSLKHALAGELPGTDIQWGMASSDRRIKDYPKNKKDDSRLAAVLILLYPYKGKIYTLFIQRPEYDGVHSGQISFPGGKEDKTDKDLSQTALREACEETGLCHEELTLLGMLTPLYIPVSDIEVSPYVAFCRSRPVFTPSKDEVVSLIEAELTKFMDPSNIKEKLIEIRGEELNVKYYDYKENVIWGATAMMLYELLVLIDRNSISLPQ